MEKTAQKNRINTQKLLAPAALVLLLLLFIILVPGFLGKYFVNILESAYFIGFLALGVTFVIITGGIDLSIGTVMMCAALVGGQAYKAWGFPLWGGLILIVAVGGIFGLLNGLMVARLSLPPFIATLGTMLVSQGLGAIATGVNTINYPGAGSADAWFKTAFYRVGDFPIAVVYLIVFFLLAFFLLNKTRFGRYTFAIGSNEEAARLSGVKVKKWKMLVYVVGGLFAGVAGIFYSATYTTVVPATGNGQELNAIAGVVIGGTSLSGGVGTVTGTIIGVFIMAVLKNGLMALGLQAHYQTFFTGIVVIGAVLLDQYRNKLALKA